MSLMSNLTGTLAHLGVKVTQGSERFLSSHFIEGRTGPSSGNRFVSDLADSEIEESPSLFIASQEVNSAELCRHKPKPPRSLRWPVAGTLSPLNSKSEPVREVFPPLLSATLQTVSATTERLPRSDPPKSAEPGRRASRLPPTESSSPKARCRRRIVESCQRGPLCVHGSAPDRTTGALKAPCRCRCRTGDRPRSRKAPRALPWPTSLCLHPNSHPLVALLCFRNIGGPRRIQR